MRTKWFKSLTDVASKELSHTNMDLQTLATAWHAGDAGKSTGRLGRPRIPINGSKPFCVTNSRQWSSVELLLRIASTNFICNGAPKQKPKSSKNWGGKGEREKKRLKWLTGSTLLKMCFYPNKQTRPESKKRTFKRPVDFILNSLVGCVRDFAEKDYSTQHHQMSPLARRKRPSL